MTSEFVVDAIPLQQRNGQLSTAPWPGFGGAVPPRRLARSRDNDMLLLGITLQNRRDQTPAEGGQRLFEHASELFFNTSGPVTTAARAAINGVNEELMKLNRAAAPAGMLQGGLICAVLRGNNLYIVQAGLGEALIMQQMGAQRLPLVPANRPLGFSQSFDVQYHHCQIYADDLLVLSARLPDPWQTPNLPELHPSYPQACLLALLNLAPNADLNLLVAQIGRAGADSELPEIVSNLQASRTKPDLTPETPPSPDYYPPLDDLPNDPAPAHTSPLPEVVERGSTLAAILARVRAADPTAPDPEVERALAAIEASLDAPAPPSEPEVTPTPPSNWVDPAAAQPTPTAEPDPEPDLPSGWLLPGSETKISVESGPAADEALADDSAPVDMAAASAPADDEDAENDSAEEDFIDDFSDGFTDDLPPDDDFPLPPPPPSDYIPPPLPYTHTRTSMPPTAAPPLPDIPAYDDDFADEFSAAVPQTAKIAPAVAPTAAPAVEPSPLAASDDSADDDDAHTEVAANGKLLQNSLEALRLWFLRLPIRPLAEGATATEEADDDPDAPPARLSDLTDNDDPESPVARRRQMMLREIPTQIYVAAFLLIPILLTVVAVYFWDVRVRQQQLESTIAAAREMAVTARLQSDLISARPYWEQVIQIVDSNPLQNPDLRSLRLEAQQNIDTLEGIVRVPMQAIISNVSREAEFTRLVTNGNDLYALDVNQQRVLRMIRAAGGTYTQDVNFRCGAGDYAQNLSVSRIIDIAFLPGPNITGQDALLVLDISGTLLYCGVGGSTLATRVNQPVNGWQQPVAIQVFGNSLYVLDAGASEIFIYRGNNESFAESADTYFGSNPLDVTNAVDFAIAQGEVFILRNNGQMTSCTRSFIGSAPTCVAVVLYSDSRPTRTNPSPESLPDVVAPIALSFTPPPEPSIFLLDAENQGAYQLSLKLVLQNQYRPTIDPPLTDQITDLAFGPDRVMYYAIGNNVYAGRRP